MLPCMLFISVNFSEYFSDGHIQILEQCADWIILMNFLWIQIITEMNPQVAENLNRWYADIKMKHDLLLSLSNTTLCRDGLPENM